MSENQTARAQDAPERICLVVIFNHNFEKNLPILDRIYSGRFDNVRYLMPFYKGSRPDVIPVYASSYIFHAYMVQAWHRLAQENYDAYVFTGDDVLLNPRLNQNNILDELKARDRSYIREFCPLWKKPYFWWHTIPSLRAFKRERYNEFHPHLQSPQEFDQAMKRHGVEQKKLGRKGLLAPLVSGLFNERKPVVFDNFVYWVWHAGGRTHEYPLVHSYSDFLIVPRRTMPALMHQLGIFASMNLFVEIAIPTALVLVEDRVTLEKDTPWKGTEALGNAAREALTAQYQFSLKAIEQAMGEKETFMHPVKLSQLKE
jgi:hypothetical protein